MSILAAVRDAVRAYEVQAGLGRMPALIRLCPDDFELLLGELGDRCVVETSMEHSARGGSRYVMLMHMRIEED